MRLTQLARFAALHNETESPAAGGLAWRAAGYAVLSEMGRLKVIDVLGVGDASPSDPAAGLGMPSNEKVLREAGPLTAAERACE